MPRFDIDRPATQIHDMTISGSRRIRFRDAGCFIHSNTDGEITLEADTKVTIGVAGHIDLGDGTLRQLRPHTDGKIDVGSPTKRMNDGRFLGEVHAEGGLWTWIETSNVSNPPTDAELDALFGQPVNLGEGFMVMVHDSTDNQYWFVAIHSDKWVYEEMHVAV